MKPTQINSVYMLGIGGIGMSAIARFYKRQGVEVSGYDKTPSPLTDQLQSEGIHVHFDESKKHVNLDADLFVFTPAIPKTHPAFEWVSQAGGKWFKRSEVLQWITEHHNTFAVAGTHGKTTTSAILSHLMFENKAGVAGFVGGVLTNYNSNLVCNEEVNYVVVEADEFDRSFLRLNPTNAVITSLDPDHLDVYGDFETMVSDYQKFADSVSDTLLVHESIQNVISHPRKVVYGTHEESDLQLRNIEAVNGHFHFDVKFLNGSRGTFENRMPGRHNAENALAAIYLASKAGIEMTDLQTALKSFSGVKRRFEHRLVNDSVVLIDDYAHHPREIDAAIEATRALYPERKLTVIFQPHLFSRTRDFEDDFVASLSKADELLLLDIYPAREEPIDGVSSANLINKVSLKTRQLVQKSEVVNTVLSLSPDVVLVLGAGDIDRLVEPLAKALKSTHHVE